MSSAPSKVSPLPTSKHTVEVNFNDQLEALKAQRNAALDEIAKMSMMVRALEREIGSQREQILKLQAQTDATKEVL